MNIRPRILATLALTLAFSSVVAQTSTPAAARPQKPTPSAGKQASTQKQALKFPPGYETDYKAMDRADIQCTFERLLGYSFGPTTVGPDGLITPSAAEFRSMTCMLPGTNPLVQAAMEVEDRYLQNGNILTKQFGAIKLKQSANDNSNVLYITDKQKDDLKKWLSEQK